MEATPDRSDDGLRGPLLPRRGARVALTVELLLLYVVVPLALWFERERFGQMIIPVLVVLAIVFTAILLRDPQFDGRSLGTRGELLRGTRRVLRVFVPAGLVVTGLTWIFEPELFLRFPRENTRTWTIVMIGYPLLSVYPQEIIFRSYLFHRYRAILPDDRTRVIASAVTFGLAHVFFANWIAPVMSAVGGWLFARTYARTRSTVIASVEHGLWGDLIFTIGLGWYFYGGAIGR